MSNSERMVYRFKGRSYYLYFIILLLSMFTAFPALALNINDLEIIPRYTLNENGFSPDVAINPITKNPHVVWNVNGDIYYSYRKADGTWMTPERIEDNGRVVYGEDEHGDRSKCIALTVDSNGLVHIIFSEDDGDLNYFNGNYGDWGVIDEIEESITSKIMLDIVESQGNIYTIYEEGHEDEIYIVPLINGSWKGKIYVERGEYPGLAKNDEGMVYFVSRDRGAVRNAIFGYIQSGSTSLNKVYGATSAVARMGGGPNLAIHDGTIYLPWCDVPGPEGPTKSHIFCSTAAEPGLSWNTKMGGDTPIYYEDTATPHPRAAVFEDGTLVLMNGRRHPHFAIWDGNEWSETREGPWLPGGFRVESNGSTIWCINSAEGNISISGIRLPGASTSNELTVEENTILDSKGHSGDVAVNPVNGSIYNLWVHDRSLRFRERHANGTWDSQESISTPGLDIHGRDSNDYPQMCSAIDVDADGTAHLLFADKDGGVHYLSGGPGNWGQPLQIGNNDGYVIYPAIINAGTVMYAAYYDVADNQIMMAEYENDQWSDFTSMAVGSHPKFYRGGNGMIYLLYQEEETSLRNARFAWRIPGFTGWELVQNITNPNDELGDNPSLGVGNGKIFMAWNNNTENPGDLKSHNFCAVADEPGLEWTSRLGSEEAIFYENTGDPHLGVSVYSDGKAVLLNGRRQSARFIEWTGEFWSGSKLGPWSNGTPRIVNDGATAWVMVSQISSTTSNVTLTGINNPDAAAMDYDNQAPHISTVPDTLASANSQWTYMPLAVDDSVDPVTWSLVVSPDAMTINPTTGMVQWTPEEADLTADLWNAGQGRFLVGIKVTDAGGKWNTQYFWLHLGGLNYPPEITSEPAVQAWVDTLFSYQVTAQDQDGDTLTYSIVQGPDAMSIDADSGLVQWTPADADEGDNDIIIRVSDGKGGKDEQEFTINVVKIVNPPEPWFTADTTSGLAPLNVQFSDHSTGDITSWAWDFGDNTSSTLQNPLHSYDQAGAYSVKLTVTGPGGVAALVREGYINIYNEDLVPQFSVAEDSGYAPFTVQFTDESTGDVSSWMWDFGDSTTSTLQNPQHTYDSVGVYTVKLMVAGNAGTGTIVKEDFIHVLPDPPTANFSAEPVEGPAPLTVAFTDLSTGNVDSWAWNFGDGNMSIEQNPVHVYTGNGLYTVTLVVTNSGGIDSLTITDYVTVKHPTFVQDEGQQVPKDFNMFQNYPNPFNAQTTISYDLPKASDVELIIFDINGQIVNILYRGVQSEGSYRMVWDGTDYHGRACASGMYIVHLQANDRLSDKKVMLVK